MGVDCDIEKIDDERYDVHCRVLDYDRAVMEFIKTAPDEEAANRVRNAWMKKGMSASTMTHATPAARNTV